MSPFKYVLFVSFLILQPFCLYAQEFYYGFTIGHGSLSEVPPMSNTDQIAADLNAPEGLSLVGEPTAKFIFDISDKDLNWKIYGGYNFNHYLGAEFGYVNFGKSLVSSTLSGNITATLPDPLVGTQTSQATLTSQSSINNKAFNLNGTFNYPFVDKFNRSRFSLFAKAGVMRWSAGGEVRQVLTPFTFQTEVGIEAPTPELDFGLFNDGKSGFNFVVGGGADVMITDGLGIRGEWTYYRGVNGRNLSILSVGGIYRFQL